MCGKQIYQSNVLVDYARLARTVIMPGKICLQANTNGTT